MESGISGSPTPARGCINQPPYPALAHVSDIPPGSLEPLLYPASRPAHPCCLGIHTPVELERCIDRITAAAWMAYAIAVPSTALTL
ncbi:hypothetical protein D3C71_956360 [compost metagenome]